MSNIRLLPDNLINQIAAGEVIERPYSVIKELVENSIDAGGNDIKISIRDGGKSYIKVSDNGKGMDDVDLEMCVQRHATSKLSDDNLFNIRTMGFRGEALASIGAVSRLTITTKQVESDLASVIKVEGGKISPVIKDSPALINGEHGTTIEVKDLFFATPARLKFLKQSGTETNHIVDLINRIAMANPNISISLCDEKKTIINYQKSLSLKERLSQVIGKDFSENSMEVDSSRGNVSVYGFCALPTLNRANSNYQFLFVNNRPVKDKLLNAALRIAYQDYLAKNRYPMVALYIEIDPSEVDINVHPAKTEVRFRDPGLVRNMLVSAIKAALEKSGQRASTTIADEIIAKVQKPTPSFGGREEIASKSVSKINQLASAFQSPAFQSPSLDLTEERRSVAAVASSPAPVSYGNKVDELSDSVQGVAMTVGQRQQEQQRQAAPVDLYDYQGEGRGADMGVSSSLEGEVGIEYPLGFAKAHVHDNYIIAENKNGIVIVDQHAAHERITYERIKKEFAAKKVAKQILLVPEVVDLPSLKHQELLFSEEVKDCLQEVGFTLEKFGDKSIMVREVPSIMGDFDIKGFINDVIDEVETLGESISIKQKINEILSTRACHGSIRSGRKLSVIEMNELLRQMEQTDFSGQCNHGRPTYVELQLKDIEKLFGRR